MAEHYCCVHSCKAEVVSVTHLDIVVILKKYQFGFAKHRSILTELLTCSNTWTKAIHRKKLVRLVYNTLKKAFDTSSQIKSVKYSKVFGISASLSAWLVGILSQKTQQLRPIGTPWRY